MSLILRHRTRFFPVVFRFPFLQLSSVQLLNHCLFSFAGVFFSVQDYDLCISCYHEIKHEHPMKKLGLMDVEEEEESAPPAASKGAGPTASPRQLTPQEIQRRSIQRCIQSLVHACQCLDPVCSVPSCAKMKRVVQHIKTCKRKTQGNCPICKQLLLLCCYHAKHCTTAQCSVPLCSNLKHKKRKQLMKQRSMQKMMMRRRMLQMQRLADSNNQPGGLGSSGAAQLLPAQTSLVRPKTEGKPSYGADSASMGSPLAHPMPQITPSLGPSIPQALGLQSNVPGQWQKNRLLHPMTSQQPPVQDGKPNIFPSQPSMASNPQPTVFSQPTTSMMDPSSGNPAAVASTLLARNPGNASAPTQLMKILMQGQSGMAPTGMMSGAAGGQSMMDPQRGGSLTTANSLAQGLVNQPSMSGTAQPGGSDSQNWLNLQRSMQQLPHQQQTPQQIQQNAARLEMLQRNIAMQQQQQQQQPQQQASLHQQQQQLKRLRQSMPGAGAPGAGGPSNQPANMAGMVPLSGTIASGLGGPGSLGSGATLPGTAASMAGAAASLGGTAGHNTLGNPWPMGSSAGQNSALASQVARQQMLARHQRLQTMSTGTMVSNLPLHEHEAKERLSQLHKQKAIANFAARYNLPPERIRLAMQDHHDRLQRQRAAYAAIRGLSGLTNPMQPNVSGVMGTMANSTAAGLSGLGAGMSNGPLGNPGMAMQPQAGTLGGAGTSAMQAMAQQAGSSTMQAMAQQAGSSTMQAMAQQARLSASPAPQQFTLANNPQFMQQSVSMAPSSHLGGDATTLTGQSMPQASLMQPLQQQVGLAPPAPSVQPASPHTGNPLDQQSMLSSDPTLLPPLHLPSGAGDLDLSMPQAEDFSQLQRDDSDLPMPPVTPTHQDQLAELVGTL